jgi:hypothetical protein
LPLRQAAQVQAAEAAHLLIGDHQKPPGRERLPIAYAAQLTGNFSCR